MAYLHHQKEDKFILFSGRTYKALFQWLKPGEEEKFGYQSRNTTLLSTDRVGKATQGEKAVEMLVLHYNQRTIQALEIAIANKQQPLITTTTTNPIIR